MGGEYKQALVQQVKNLQREGPLVKAAWYNFVLNTPTNKKDPACHSEETLQKFIDGYQSGEIQPMEMMEYEYNAKAKHDANQEAFIARGGIPGQSRSVTPAQALMNNPMMGMMKNMMDMFTGGNGETAMKEMMKAMGCDPDEKGKGGGKGAGRPGDWECPNCGNINFSRNRECKQCGTSGEGVERIGMKKGDWICPACGDLVFASKSQCKMCGHERATDDSYDSNSWSKKDSWKQEGSEELNSWNQDGSSSRALPY